MTNPGSESTPAPEQARWFLEQVHPHDQALKGYLRGSFPKMRDVDDVVQESYLKIWQARRRQPIDSARAFLFRIARNLALNLTGREQRSPVA